MPTITALLHTQNDALRIGRCLETLYPCDEIVVVDHGSSDATVQLARGYGARVMEAVPGAGVEHYLRALHPRDEGWILCLDPHESLSEGLAASVYQWKAEWRAAANGGALPAFSMFLREETGEGWVNRRAPETRLVPVGWSRWHGWFPVSDTSALALEGELLRFAFP
jgi:glycosyltransferase involved in cell wall biosynthesis